MTAFNSVRFHVKPGQNEAFIAAHEKVDRSSWPGLKHASIVQTGEQDFCIIGEWDSMDSLAAARPSMIATLDTFRDMLDGDTDPVSGPVVLELK